MSRRFIPVFALLAACSGALAQPQPPVLSDAAKAMAGTWEFTNADRDKTCTITLRLDSAAHGMRAEFDRTCAAKFPFIGEIVAWTFNENDFLRLVDAKGVSILEFNEVESGVYEAPRPGEGILFIQNPGASGPPLRTAEETTGEWTVMRAGKPICALTLSNIAAGEDFAIRIRQPCDALVMRFGPTTWQVERGELVLKPAKGARPWRFEDIDANTWQRLPANVDPIALVRK
jgi:hypothetical protein